MTKWTKKKKEWEEDNKKQGKVTPPQNTPDDIETSRKIKVSPKKPYSWKKSKARKPKMETVLTVDDIDLIIATVSDNGKYIL